MTRTAHFRLLAEYNAWMNGKIYDACGGLSAEALAENRGAFFGSILGTLEHLVVADTIWLKRFAQHPAGVRSPEIEALPTPSSLAMIQFAALEPLRARRALLDRTIGDWVGGLAEADLDLPFSYSRANGEAMTKDLGLVLVHFFNHQTHHRGQATTLLSQVGVDIGVTDLVSLIPNIA